MAKTINWDSRIGRRVRLRDLHILFAVAQHGSMAKAGVHLNMSQSAVSQAIAAIEHTLGVRVADRTSRRGAHHLWQRAATTRPGSVRRTPSGREGDREPGGPRCRRSAYSLRGGALGGTASAHHRTHAAAISAHQ